jgi:hypothetical protein
MTRTILHLSTYLLALGAMFLSVDGAKAQYTWQQYTEAPVCTGTGCSWDGPPPTITGTCATAGAGMSVAGNNFYGRVTCAAAASTTATITWSPPRNNVPSCVVNIEVTGAWVGITPIVNTATSLSVTYASVGNQVIDYVCGGT